MPKKRTYEYVENYFKKEGYILLTKKYKDNKQKLDFICPKGHKYSISFNNFQRGHRCQLCRIEKFSGDGSHLWKGGVRKLDLPLFDTYAHQLDFCEEVRRDPDDERLLQVRCTESGCKKWFVPKAKNVRKRLEALNNSIRQSRFYCSDKCKENCSIFGQILYPKGFKVNTFRDPEVQAELRAMVLERDNYECQRCEVKENLECHHIESIWTNPIESADMDVCITLCEKCHDLAHTEIGCRYIDLRKENICVNY